MLALGAALIAGALALGPGGEASAQAPLVDLELVLAVDISGSIDDEEARLQREGYVGALRHPQVVAAIRSGYQGRIAVTYVEWAGEHVRRTVAEWATIADEASATAFADVVAAAPISTGMWTSISGAIEYGRERFRQSPYRGKRRVLDISGDGPNNHGEFVLTARDRALKEGIIINGLPIVNNKPSRFGMPQAPDLDLYYEECVIGGSGAFVVVANTFQDFARAIRQKLILEIANLPFGVPLIEKAERPRPGLGVALESRGRAWKDGPLIPADAPRRVDCLQGERQRQYGRDR